MTAKGLLATLALLLFLIVSFSLCGSETRAQSTGGAAPGLRVTISTEQAKIHAGETLVLRVVIFNEGKETVFVGKELNGADNALSLLRLSVFLTNGKPVGGPGSASAADSGRYRDDRKPPLATQFSKYWIALSPGNFYGGTVALGPHNFDGLAPGKYRVKGTYRSDGFLPDGANNPLANYVDELAQMPFAAWTGMVNTNSLLIELVTSQKR